jgi:hypothetical protein
MPPRFEVQTRVRVGSLRTLCLSCLQPESCGVHARKLGLMRQPDGLENYRLGVHIRIMEKTLALSIIVFAALAALYAITSGGNRK